MTFQEITTSPHTRRPTDKAHSFVNGFLDLSHLEAVGSFASQFAHLCIKAPPAVLVLALPAKRLSFSEAMAVVVSKQKILSPMKRNVFS